MDHYGGEIMPEKRKKNLNTTPLQINKQHRKTSRDFHFRSDGIKIVGKETDMQECKECRRILPTTAFTTKSFREDGAYTLQKACRECKTTLYKEQRESRKNASPKPERCERCHKKVEKLQIDHLHGTFTFRGWLCRECNTGIGSLGDNLEGVLQAAVYLENDKNKIIEILDKVYNEVFARTA